jgi:hypothetical protein
MLWCYDLIGLVHLGKWSLMPNFSTTLAMSYLSEAAVPFGVRSSTNLKRNGSTYCVQNVEVSKCSQ